MKLSQRNMSWIFFTWNWTSQVFAALYVILTERKSRVQNDDDDEGGGWKMEDDKDYTEKKHCERKLWVKKRNNQLNQEDKRNELFLMDLQCYMDDNMKMKEENSVSSMVVVVVGVIIEMIKRWRWEGLMLRKKNARVGGGRWNWHFLSSSNRKSWNCHNINFGLNFDSM